MSATTTASQRIIDEVASRRHDRPGPVLSSWHGQPKRPGCSGACVELQLVEGKLEGVLIRARST
jgi:hypothetical protein